MWMPRNGFGGWLRLQQYGNCTKTLHLVAFRQLRWSRGHEDLQLASISLVGLRGTTHGVVGPWLDR
jgi:hypothetical protein